ncbi:VapA/VapB family virulence-associated protein [Atlantibacter hermannii]|uniref:VapA/VapB family virulence-associated protein n=1 Tax=Atlantibacter hermannii TaxID=565 RepID=UPI0034D507E1
MQSEKQEAIQSSMNQLKNYLDTSNIESIKSHLETSNGSVAAQGSIASFIFYLRFQVTVSGGKTFNGEAGGLSSPGGGGFWGDIYTNDLGKLYRETVSFQFNATPVYLNINFFNKNHECLGSMHAGSVSIVSGVGGGSGSWS